MHGTAVPRVPGICPATGKYCACESLVSGLGPSTGHSLLPCSKALLKPSCLIPSPEESLGCLAAFIAPQRTATHLEFRRVHFLAWPTVFSQSLLLSTHLRELKALALGATFASAVKGQEPRNDSAVLRTQKV